MAERSTMPTAIRPLPGGSSAEAVPGSALDGAIRRRIIEAYSNPVIRLYASLRFRIINSGFLEMIEQHLPPEGRVLDLGCGFGLFDCYFAQHGPRRDIHGIEINPRRVALARQTAAALGLPNIAFSIADATTLPASAGPFDAVVVLDLMHHVSREAADHLIEVIHEQLRPGGVFIMKDVGVSPFWKLWFTYLLDKVMMPFKPVHYRDGYIWRDTLHKAGFSTVYLYRINDYLPYPHILLVCSK
ncbi:MAG: class I SAM-dependent methyltransferase [Anaerolineae bacterium]|nr:class I SAM-dependent methyltransferase [Anaerolineae bacterium]